MTFLSIKTSKLNKKNIELNFIIVFLLFALFFIVGITVFRDYGISVDEWELREMGFANLKYIVNIFFSSYLNDLDALVSTREISNHYYTHGVIFALPMAFIEYIFDITDSRNYYLLRHYSNHLIFLISIFYFYLLAKNKFNSLILGIFAALFLFLSPRIFASSFFNQKDIKHAYANGRGGVVVRGEAEIVEDKRGAFSIVITSIPYRVNKADLQEKIANLVREKKIEGIREKAAKAQSDFYSKNTGYYKQDGRIGVGL